MAAGVKFRLAALATLTLLAAANIALSALERNRASSVFSLELAALPLEISGWQGRDHAVSERERRILGSPNLLFRSYRKGEMEVNLYILESAANRASFHPPEYCYVGGRTEMVERARVELEGIPARRFVFVGPRGRSLVYYWYTFGDEITDSYYRQQLQIVSRLFAGEPSPAMLVRLSVEGRFDLDQGDAIIRSFVNDARPAFKKHLLRPAAAEMKEKPL